jgi:hypothetical protein
MTGGSTSTGGAVVLGLLYFGSRQAATGSVVQLPGTAALGLQEFTQQSPPVVRTVSDNNGAHEFSLDCALHRNVTLMRWEPVTRCTWVMHKSDVCALSAYQVVVTTDVLLKSPEQPMMSQAAGSIC